MLPDKSLKYRLAVTQRCKPVRWVDFMQFKSFPGISFPVAATASGWSLEIEVFLGNHRSNTAISQPVNPLLNAMGPPLFVKVQQSACRAALC